MGNQSSLQLAAGQAANAAQNRNQEPLESYIREKQRDDHLKNLGFKRSRSLRKSISKRLRRRHDRQSNNTSKVDEPDSNNKPESSKSEATKTTQNVDKVEKSTSVEKLDRNTYPEVKKRARPLVGEPQPLPCHVQVLN